MIAKHRLGLSATLVLALAAAGFSSSAAAAGNPLDNVGVEHNAYLGCLMADASQPPSLQLLVSRCGYRPQGSVEDFIKTFQPYMPTSASLSYSQRIEPYRSQFTAGEYAFVKRIEAALSPQAQSPEEIDRALAALEAQALAQLGDKSQGARGILASLSVARHSLQFWTPYYIDRLEDSHAKLPKWLRVVIKVVATVATDAAVGALLGSNPVTAPAAGPAAGAASGIVAKEL
ncbi:hypothetical protein [Lysobacter enzymogenes]|uniref:hypothetical protein n=1 Tax=Lysobacter enzymogenes TaxID=69 RepID=UPI00089D5D91|nr:hypothetical protein [Lysobacter enzymogenes]SDW05898.1 hypothetical protein SAMN05421681_10134 [Lysobacter enzymogenes]